MCELLHVRFSEERVPDVKIREAPLEKTQGQELIQRPCQTMALSIVIGDNVVTTLRPFDGKFLGLIP